MAPKKKKGGAKKSKCPPGMTPEMFALSNNLPKLSEFWSGDVKESKGGKGKDGKPLLEVPSISKEQAGLFIWRLVFPLNKAAKEKREECIKLAIIETSVKVMSSGLASGKFEEVTPAVGILSSLAENLDQGRQILLDSKPSPLPNLLKALTNNDSASLMASSCSLLRVLAQKEDSRTRLWKAMKDWDWAPLFKSCLQIQDLSQLGGRNAALDVMQAISALCSAPEGPVSDGACQVVINHQGLEPMIHLMSDRVSHPLTRGSILSVLEAIMRKSPGSVSEHIINGLCALKPIISMFEHPVVPLFYKAHGAACLLRYIMPDSLWRDQSSLSKTTAATIKAPPPAPLDTATESNSPETLGINKNDELKQAVAQSIETSEAASSQPAISGNKGAKEPMVPDMLLMDDETRTEVLRRARIVANMGAIKPLIQLCNGPDGPRPDLEAKAAAAAAAAEAGEEIQDAAAEGAGNGKKKKGGKKGGKKKKGKLEPGMADAQTYASGVLRLISLDEGWRDSLVKEGVVRYLLPLVEAKLSPARWNSRQLLINLSMSPQLMPHLKLYSVPDHVSGRNLPKSHYDRPYVNSLSDELERLPAHLAEARIAVQEAREKSNSGSFTKPPALRSTGGGH